LPFNFKRVSKKRKKGYFYQNARKKETLWHVFHSFQKRKKKIARNRARERKRGKKGDRGGNLLGAAALGGDAGA